jgi:pteridine reductase
MSNNPLHGQAALITGAAVRLGRQTALTLADHGVNIVAHYSRSGDPASALCREIQSRGVKAFPIQADLQKPEDRASLIARAVEAVGPLGILINNASIFPLQTLDDLTLPGLMENVQVNAWAPLELARNFARSAHRGKIVNLEDSRLRGYDFAHAGYILSKHMLSLITRMLAVKLAPHFTVNAVAPGLILPPPGKDQSYLDRLVATVPLQRHGSPADIANAVLFLLESDFITGQVIYVDGGRHLREYEAHGPHPHQGPADSLHPGDQPR